MMTLETDLWLELLIGIVSRKRFVIYCFYVFYHIVWNYKVGDIIINEYTILKRHQIHNLTSKYVFIQLYENSR